MTEIDRIRQQMVQAFVGKAWHGPSLAELLADVNANKAADRPIPQRHTIWEIVLHLQTAQELILDRLRGTSPPFAPGDDWPAVVEITQEAWQETVARLEAGDQDVRDAVARFPEEQLEVDHVQALVELEADLLEAPQATIRPSCSAISTGVVAWCPSSHSSRSLAEKGCVVHTHVELAT